MNTAYIQSGFMAWLKFLKEHTKFSTPVPSKLTSHPSPLCHCELVEAFLFNHVFYKSFIQSSKTWFSKKPPFTKPSFNAEKVFGRVNSALPPSASLNMGLKPLHDKQV